MQDSRRYRSGHSHSRSNSANLLDYSSNERPPSHMVTPTSQISSGRSRHAPTHHEPHHGHHGHHHHHHKQAREGPTPFDDDGDSNSSVDTEVIQRDTNGGYGDNFEIPHRMLRIIMPELFEHLNESSYNEHHLTESVNYSSRYTSQESERPRQRLDLESIKALNKQRVTSLADDAWMYEVEEDPNPIRYRRQLYQSR
ncbi:hypothetical protein ABW20_dc0108327 [Dactylellina cionopaga]|nr:hypothetical protein ABW20_dc0108327 [Dactylellina cionopaga]